jgi:hypothetical protein
VNYKDPGGLAAVAKASSVSSTAKEKPNLIERLKELVKPPTITPTTKIIPPIVPPPPPPPPPRPPQNTGTKMVVEATGSGGSSDWDVFLCIKLDMQVKTLSLLNRIFC